MYVVFRRFLISTQTVILYANGIVFLPFMICMAFISLFFFALLGLLAGTPNYRQI